jgi:hypothetical protein
MFTAVVKEPNPERVRVEIIDGAELVTKAEWDALVKESDERIEHARKVDESAKNAKELPQAA